MLQVASKLGMRRATKNYMQGSDHEQNNKHKIAIDCNEQHVALYLLHGGLTLIALHQILLIIRSTR